MKCCIMPHFMGVCSDCEKNTVFEVQLSFKFNFRRFDMYIDTSLAYCIEQYWKMYKYTKCYM